MKRASKEEAKKYFKENGLTSEDFEKWMKEIFANNNKPQKRWTVIGHETIIGLRKEMGDDWLYSFVKSVNIMCGEDTAKYIEDFINKYESKKKHGKIITDTATTETNKKLNEI